MLLIRKPERTLAGIAPLPIDSIAATIPSEDIGMVVVDEPQTTYTHAALAELCEQGAVLVVCGRDHQPSGVLLSMGSHNEIVWRLQDQIRARRPLQKQLWQSIIRAKIRAQAAAMPESPGLEARRSQLAEMAKTVRSGDRENVEAQAARLYWSAWLGSGHSQVCFSREAGCTPSVPPNNFLDYGYAILRAAVARAIVGAGLLPAIGINHHHRSNAFCLADDLMEPLRPIIDVRARALFASGERVLTQPNKAALLMAATATVRDSTGRGPLLVVLHRYIASFTLSLSTGKDALDIPVAENLPVGWMERTLKESPWS